MPANPLVYDGMTCINLQFFASKTNPGNQEVGYQQYEEADVVGDCCYPRGEVSVVRDVEVATENQDSCQNVQQCSQTKNQMILQLKSSFLICVSNE